MYLVLTIAFISIAIGCALKAFITQFLTNILEPSSKTARAASRVPSIQLRDGFFNHFDVRIPSDTNAALEAIFDIIVDRYIISWYRTLTDNADFVVQVRMHLQHLSAVLIARAKEISPAEYFVSDFVNVVADHVEHILPLLISGNHMDSFTEESVLRTLGPHLHVCLSSRSAEIAYLRALINRLLPYIGLPPGFISNLDDVNSASTDFPSFKAKLLSPKRSLQTPTTRDQPLPRSMSVGMLHTRLPNPVKLGANRAAYSFLTEILSTCVLLPAMDSLATPDLFNKTLLECLNPKPTPLIQRIPVQVPVLHTYLKEYRSWLSEKPIRKTNIEQILQTPSKCCSFIQYMKSIKSTVPITAVLLLTEIDQRVHNGPLSPDVCREIRTQLYHVLTLVRSSAHPTPDDYALFESDKLLPPVLDRSRLFDLPDEFDLLLIDFLERSAVPTALFRLIDSAIWTRSCRIAYEAIEERYLPLYMESPEYLAQLYGVSLRSTSKASSPTNSPKNSQQQQNASGLFGLSLKNRLVNNVVEGKVLSNHEQDFNRPAAQLNSKRGSYSRGNALTIDSQHQLHSHYLSNPRAQIDMTGWHVFIPGLSRPEIRPQRRLIDQLMMPAMQQPPPLYSTRPHDGAFRDKVTKELNQLQSNENRAPQLSSQFFFTVRTEHLVNGVYQPIERVDRKYSEFYILEQKLQEFHGNAITRQLPRKQFTPRTFEFLETKRELFEEYLQYLLTQPFLRNSELLHGFLTSKSAFSSSVFELNLSRFAKSVPLKLVRERGQYVDNFLVTFYLSCNPQPIMLTPEPDPPCPTSALPTITPGSGVGIVGGIDSLGPFNPVSPTSPNPRGGRPRRKNPELTRNPASTVQTIAERRGLKLNWLDTRLRMKMFWNNAGLTVNRRNELQNMPCDRTIHVFHGIVELPIFLLRHLIEPVTELTVDSDLSDATSTSTTPSSHPHQSGSPSPLSCPPEIRRNPIQPWDITHDGWSEALLNGPAPIPFIESKVMEPSTLPSVIEVPKTVDLPDPMEASPEKLVTIQSAEMVSITWMDVVASVRCLCKLILEHVVLRVRHFVLWLTYVVHGYFQPHVDWYLRSVIERIVNQTLTDQFMSSGLELLKVVLFFPYVPSTEAEKLERRTQANTALKDFALNSQLSHLLDRQSLNDVLDRLFLCFQYPKLNKQLTYVLLDRFILTLFPELLTSSSESTPSE